MQMIILDAIINGIRINMMLDTGAAYTTLCHQTACRIGVSVEKLVYSIPVATQNGITHAAEIMLPLLYVGPFKITNLRTHVAQKGCSDMDLLGINFLYEFESWEYRNNRLMLRCYPPRYNAVRT